jgi:hypothetical protein
MIKGIFLEVVLEVDNAPLGYCLPLEPPAVCFTWGDPRPIATNPAPSL